MSVLLMSATVVLVAYALGNVMGGDVLRAVLGGSDLRSSGSGNVGATNALRTRGKSFALGVLAIDAGKGVLAALGLPAVLATAPPALPYVCGIAVALGHCYPVFHHFRGGKGVATLAGVFGALLTPALPWMLGLFVLVLLVTGYVSLGSLVAAAVAVVWVAIRGTGLLSAAGLFTVAMAVLVTFKHRENIARLAAGTESRFERIRVIGRRFDQWRGR